MSLLEDIRDVLYVILEYFGVPPDMVSYLHTSGIRRFICSLFDVIVPSLVAGSSVGQSDVWFISQPRSHDWDQPPTGTFTPGSFSGTGIMKANPHT